VAALAMLSTFAPPKRWWTLSKHAALAQELAEPPQADARSLPNRLRKKSKCQSFWVAQRFHSLRKNAVL
jgi:hypothetical protein